MAIEYVVSRGEVPWAEKDKDSTPDFEFDVSRLMAIGDRLESVTWNITGGSDVTIIEQSFLGQRILAVFKGGQPGTWYAATATMKTDTNITLTFTLRLYIQEDVESLPALGSALFPNRFSAVSALRRDRLMMAGISSLPDHNASDDYLWSKFLAAEATLSDRLRVKLQPTRFFSMEPTQEEIDALVGMPWEVDPAYDYEPNMLQADQWGFFTTRHKPIVQLHSVRLSYPEQTNVVLEFPKEWLRVDKRYGQVQLVPTGGVTSISFASSMLGGMISARRLPFAMHVNYTAGLSNVRKDYPDIVDLVQKMAVLSILGDSFNPQSGSISADGLSQNVSMDMSKYQDEIELAINGPKGANGGLVARIHGVRMGVL